MAKLLVANNAYSTLAGSITAIATTLAVQAGHGARFPNPTGGDWFMLTLQDASNNIEVVKVTARSTDTLTIERAQEGTSARAWASADVVECRFTAGIVATTDSEQTITNKTIDANANTVLNVGVDQLLNTVAGTDTITAAANAGITSYIAGQVFSFVAVGDNTGSATLNINSLGAKNIRKAGGSNLNARDISFGSVVTVIYDGTQFQLASAILPARYESKTIATNTTLSANTEYETGSDTRLLYGVNLSIPVTSCLQVKAYQSGQSL
jgi:hypothetical protein